MLRYLLNTKVTDRLLVFLIILISSRASVIANSEVTIFITLLINVGVMTVRRIKVDRPFMFVAAAFFLFTLQNYFQNDGQLNWLRYLKLFSMISIGYCTIKIVRFDFFSYYNKFIYTAILFSLPFYMWQVISAESLHSFGMFIDNLFPFLVENQPSSQNIIFHTIEFVDRYRNSGPMWEPGGFATMIVLAIYFQFLKTGFKFSRRIGFYFLGVIITFSTTGYLLCLLLLFIYLLNIIRTKPAKVRFAFYVVILPAFITTAVSIFLYSDLMYNKIQFLYADQMAKVEDVQRVEGLNLDEKFSLGRFGSMLVDIQSIENNPLFGRGYDDDNFRHQSYGSFNLTNGLSNYTARLGLIGLLWLLFSLRRSGRLIEVALSGSSRNNNLLILIVPLIAFSNPVLFTPLYLMLSFLFIPFKPVKEQSAIL